MADILVVVEGSAKKRLQDMSDGTWAEVVTQHASSPEVSVLGATTGAAVVTDATGTIQQYLRGLVKLIVAKITVGIDQTTPGTTNAVSAVLTAGSAVIGHVIADTGSTTAATQATASNLNAQVVGTVASGAPDSGNPVKVGGVYNSTLPTLTDAQRGDFQLNNRGAIYTAQSFSGVICGQLPDNSDANAASPVYQNLLVLAKNYVFNGTTFDRQRGDTTGTYAVGNVASGAADSGNPVKMGGKYNATLPTLTDGNRGDAQLDINGRQIVVGAGYKSEVSLTRTADTNAYAANDVLGTGTSAGNAVLTFATVGPTSGHIMISQASLTIQRNAVISGETSYRLYLYNASPNSNLADNAAFDLTVADSAQCVGYIDLGTPVDLGTCLLALQTSVSLQVAMPAGTSLYGYLVTNGAYTPASATVHLVRLNTMGM